MRHTRNEDEISWDSAWANLEVTMPCLAATRALMAILEIEHAAEKISFPAQKLIPE